MPDDEIMTVKELAEYLKIAEKTAYRFAAEGKVPGFKVGNAWRFRKQEIEHWIAKQSKSGGKKDG
jgi:excisionase family DNA binding protein